MNATAILFVSLLLAIASVASASETATDTGYREDTTILDGPTPDTFCPSTNLRRHDDNVFENGWTWKGGGQQAPDYGAWAEGYTANTICAIQFFFTQTGYFLGQSMDVYVWDVNDGGAPPPGPDPGNVICLLAGIVPDPIAFWPSISTHDVQVCCEAGGDHFVGYWGNWPGQLNGWFVAVDEDGWSGFGEPMPRTKIAPGIGYPTGWHIPQDTVPIMENIRALGIRIRAGPGDCLTSGVPDPDDAEASSRQTTWGAIKALY